MTVLTAAEAASFTLNWIWQLKLETESAVPVVMRAFAWLKKKAQQSVTVNIWIWPELNKVIQISKVTHGFYFYYVLYAKNESSSVT